MSTLTQFVGGGGGGVKGVQRGFINVTAAMFEPAVTISPVTMTKSLLIFYGRANDTFETGREGLSTFSGQIANSTTLRFRRNATGTGFYTVNIEWQVIEYE